MHDIGTEPEREVHCLVHVRIRQNTRVLRGRGSLTTGAAFIDRRATGGQRHRKRCDTAVHRRILAVVIIVRVTCISPRIRLLIFQRLAGSKVGRRDIDHIRACLQVVKIIVP